ncbi:TadE family type IV pilus minor pilin [Haloechinothrix salitolerans]|uniref:TadE family type IV pilus minor pilin n=1 Tax=Haloechinothrix salitolerans TaxID=926830 RepID=UPI0036F39130
MLFPRRGDDTGTVTVEAAISLASLVGLLVLVLAGIGAVTDQLRCTDAAREAVRLAARGDPDAARRAVAAIAPNGASLEFVPDADGLVAVVRSVPVGGLLPGVRIEGAAFAIIEPGVVSVESSPEGPSP